MMPAEYRAREFDVIYYDRCIGVITKLARFSEDETCAFMPYMEVLEKYGNAVMDRFGGLHGEYESFLVAEAALNKTADRLAFGA